MDAIERVNNDQDEITINTGGDNVDSRTMDNSDTAEEGNGNQSVVNVSETNSNSTPSSSSESSPLPSSSITAVEESGTKNPNLTSSKQSNKEIDDTLDIHVSPDDLVAPISETNATLDNDDDKVTKENVEEDHQSSSSLRGAVQNDDDDEDCTLNKTTTETSSETKPNQQEGKETENSCSMEESQTTETVSIIKSDDAQQQQFGDHETEFVHPDEALVEAPMAVSKDVKVVVVTDDCVEVENEPNISSSAAVDDDDDSKERLDVSDKEDTESSPFETKSTTMTTKIEDKSPISSSSSSFPASTSKTPSSSLSSSKILPKWLQHPKQPVKNNKSERKTSITSKSDQKMLMILSLPIDSLHSIASFLTPTEWSNFSLCNKGTNKICHDVIRRVRLHGFRCATEVVTAWKLGQHADAKELCALYVQSGVPIYPPSLGHSYHTLLWRLQAEVKHMEETSTETTTYSTNQTTDTLGATNENRTNSRTGNNGTGGESNGTGNNDAVDSFYSNRDEARRSRVFLEEFGSTSLRTNNLPYSYLEEKAVYVVQAHEHNQPDVERLTRSLRRQMSIDPLARTHSIHQHRDTINSQQRISSISRGGSLTVPSSESEPPTRRPIGRSNSFSEVGYRPPKVMLKVHRHLLDQHLLGRSSVFDHNGDMTTPRISLSADFFHPFFSFRQQHRHNQHLASLASSGNDALSTEGVLSGHLVPAWNADRINPGRSRDTANLGVYVEDELNVPEAMMGPAGYAVRRAVLESDNDSDSEDDSDDSDGDSTAADQTDDAVRYVPPPPQDMAPPPPLPPQPVRLWNSSSNAPTPVGYRPFTHRRRNWLENVDLDVYSASSTVRDDGDVDLKIHQLVKHLKIRFAAYHRRLEKHLSNRDVANFDECILDFWDEFLPQTASIHYFDQHTAVPRLSCLHKFLTKPCPKAVGIVQCEIERIKLGSKKKGVNVKGRFFPTYEYRLFIRHRHADPSYDNQADDEGDIQRRDTVLMMAKNRGRKHSDSPNHSLSPFTQKKGSNNYYLHLPKQEDVDAHYESVNGLESESKPTPNGASVAFTPDDNPALLGRLQSNFIGTEFQIYTPSVSKQQQQQTKQVPKPKAFASTSRSSSLPLNDNSGMISDDDILQENEVSTDPLQTSSGRRLSRFRRLSLMGIGKTSGDHHRSNAADEEPSGPVDTPSSTGITLRRSRSSGDIPPSRKTRTNRRVSAADAVVENQYSVQPPTQVTLQPVVFTEVENGAITYTANLLGSRPRIMDVCIPRVSTDGLPGMEWREYLEHSDDPEVSPLAGNVMLNHLKVLQQRSEEEETGGGGGGGRDNQATTTGVAGLPDRPATAGDGGGSSIPSSQDGTMDSGFEGPYIPPDDFGLLALQNRPPWWNVELGSFVLNFGGRVSVASVKNFQLCDKSDQDYIMLQFGRISGRHSFTMDFQYPLSGVQAFAMAISSLQSKISFG